LFITSGFSNVAESSHTPPGGLIWSVSWISARDLGRPVGRPPRRIAAFSGFSPMFPFFSFMLR
jgi:hypothetical protein